MSKVITVKDISKKFKISIFYIYFIFYLFTNIYREVNIQSLSIVLFSLGFLYVFSNNRTALKSSLVFVFNALFYFVAFYWSLLLGFNSFNYDFIDQSKNLSKKDNYYISKINEAKKINMYLDIHKSYKLYISYNHVVDKYFDKLNKDTIENDFVNKIINLEFEKYQSVKNGLVEGKKNYSDKLFLLLDSLIMKGEKEELNAIETEFLVANIALYFTELRYNGNRSSIDLNKRVEYIKRLNIKLQNDKINRVLDIYK